jgi:hypothetical protein
MKPLALLVVLAVLIGAGCKKKPKPPVDDGNQTPAGQSSGDGARGAGGGGGGGNDPTIVPSAGAGGGVVISTGGGGGGGGAAMAVRKAVRRAGAMNEMKNIGEIIETLRSPEGKMPTKDEIIAALKQSPQLYAGVTEGAYILTGTTDGGGLWLFEVDAENKGGIVVVGGRATRANEDEVKQYIANLSPDVRAKLYPPAPQPKQSPAPMPQPKVAPAPNISKQDMEDIRIFIDNASAGGQMPSPQLVYSALVMNQSPAAAHVKSGAIVVHPARSREEVWAYEARALQQGGWMVTANGVEQVNANDLKRRLGR